MSGRAHSSVATAPRAVHSGSRAVAVVLAASTLTIMAAAVISPSLPAMRSEFIDVPGVEVMVRLVVTITSAAIAVSAPLAGLVTARIGTRPVLVAGLILYAIAGTSGLVVDDLGLLLLVRVILGIGVGAIMTAISTTIVTLWVGDRRTQLIGAQQLFASLGGVIFLSLAGWLSTVDWRAPFWIYGVSLLLLPLVAVTPLARPVPRDGGPETDQGGPAVVRLAACIYLLALTATAVFFLVPTQLPFALEQMGISGSATGLIIAASTATGVVGSMAFAPLRRRLSSVSVAVLSLVLMGVGWLVVGTSVDTTWVGVLAGTLVGGIGVGLIVPDLNLWLSDQTVPARRGLILGGLVSAIFAGQFLSPLLAQPLIDLLGVAATFTTGGAVLLAPAFILILFELHARRQSDGYRNQSTERKVHDLSRQPIHLQEGRDGGPEDRRTR